MTPDLLRDALKELLYGPGGSFGLSVGLFSAGEAGLLRAAHAFTAQQAGTPPAPGRPTPAQIVVHIRQHLAYTAALLHDPHALRPDEPDAWETPAPSAAQWRLELVALARVGGDLNDALYRPLDAEAERTALGGLLHAAYHTGALRFHLTNVAT